MLSAAWLAGVLLGLSVQVEHSLVWLLAGAAGLTALGMHLARLPAFPAVLMAVLLLGLGRAELHGRDQVSHAFYGQRIIAEGTIASDPETTARQVRFELNVFSVEVDGQRSEVEERWLVYASPPDDLVTLRTPPCFRYGDAVMVRGTPLHPEPIDGFDYASYLEAQGISATVFAEDALIAGRGGTWWRSAIFAARGRLADSIERSMPYPESALAMAMLLGKRESLPPDLVEAFRGTGAAHLLAISGLHVGVLLAVSVGTAAWLLGRQRPTYLIVAAIAIWSYALVAGASPSALRAAVMGSVYLSALGLGRPSSVLPALALAAVAMTAVTPGLIRQVSFQLSFAAVGGIAVALALSGGRLDWGAARAAGIGRKLLGWAGALTVVSAAATLATWPLVADNFGRVALTGVPVSLLAIPAMAPLIVATMIAAVAGLAFHPLGELLGWIATAPTTYLIAVVSAFPSWTLESNGVSCPLLVTWYAGLGIVLLAAQPRWTRGWRRGAGAFFARVLGSFKAASGRDARGGDDDRRWPLPSAYLSFAAAAALGIAALILWLRVAGGPDGNLHVYFLDIGQGDSTLIVAPSGRQVLIDGGPDGDVTSRELARVLPGGDRSLDLVILTHLDADHSHGLLEVLGRYSVGGVAAGVPAANGAMGAEWEQRLRQHGIAQLHVSEGYVIQLGDELTLEVLNPSLSSPLGDSNNDSVAVRLIHGNVSFLLTADMEEEAELRIVNSGLEIGSTVLKAGHHGSHTSTTQRFLDTVSPSVAVISSGIDNSYGHPVPSVVERLEDSVGVENVYRTDLQGTVEVVSDGEVLWVETER